MQFFPFRELTPNWLEAVQILLENNADIFKTRTYEWKENDGNKKVAYSQKFSIIGSVVYGKRSSTCVDEETFSVIDLLLKQGADINALTLCKIDFSNGNGYLFAASPIFQALIDKNFTLAEYLLYHGADTEALVKCGAYSPGFTPLLFAINFGLDDAVRFLLAHDADPTNKGNSKYTPLSLALNCMNMPIAEEIACAIEKKYTNLANLLMIDYGSLGKTEKKAR